ncbi:MULTISPECIES: hypothetical protein [Flavobacteriaceae]|uniref:TnsE C-terminal domain-containing protein n=2 Tax=Flavobacteriaceae TaxID=49546 RepID=A0A4Y8ARD7_9FLAO|nr:MULTISPECIES: hypothetical protein [Flavobacteriaceae]TEW72937.1 hypothetical protein E2488_12140 [Gramella jeungdoensis]GGK48329.1 hypothetical protein GCM10007963_15870 [Lutibacter litoralis]
MAYEEKNCKILKIKENKFYYTQADFIHISDTNFPPAYFGFSSGRPRYWKINVLKFNQENLIIEAEILDYNYEKVEDFNLQKRKSDVGGFKFVKIIWSSLKPCLTHFSEYSYKQIPDAFIDYSYSVKEIHSEKEIEINSKRYHWNNPALERPNLIDNHQKLERIENNSNLFKEIATTPIKQEISINFSEYYKNASFKEGYVEVRTYVKEFSSQLDVKIENDQIIANYDFIKYYFSKVSGSKKFNISATLTFLDGILENTNATSDEIAAINEFTIEQVKDAISLDIINIKSTGDEDSSIYTADEILSKSNECQNVFNQTENEIIDRITKIKSVRNKKQLLFLSGKQLKEAKIRFTLDKNFGYLFLMKNGCSKIVSWELLHSNATYIWLFDENKSNDEIFDRMQIIIKTIEVNGRKKYRAAVKRKEIDSDLNFKLINHTGANNIGKDGFMLWKKKLEEYLSNVK